MENTTLCMRAWCEVRHFASQKFRLTPELIFLRKARSQSGAGVSFLIRG